MTRDYQAIVEEYCTAVESGRRVAGKLELAAVSRYRDDCRTGSDRGLRFDSEAAQRALAFVELLELTEGEFAGQSLILAPWQVFCVWNIAGWKSIDTGYRRFRQAFISVARGNGKTPFGAALALYFTGFDSPAEAEAQGYSTATTRGQAKIAFRQAKSFVESSTRSLKSYCHPMAHELKFPGNRAFFTTVSADGRSTDGFNPQFILRDEFHAWTEFHGDFNDKLETAMAKRRQPLMLTITTAGDDESALWLSEYNLCKLVLQGHVTKEDLFAWIAEIDGEPGDPVEEIDDPLDEACWSKANPMIDAGVVKIAALRSIAERARIDPQTFDKFKRYHTNKLSTSATRLFRSEQWALGRGPIPWGKIDAGEVFAFAALDWGWKDDLAALGWVFDLGAEEEDGEWKRRYAIHSDIWVPSGGPRNLAKSPWREWIADGWITPTEGATTDTAAIHRTFAERWSAWDVRGVAYDSNNGREWGSYVRREYGLEPYAFQQSYSKYNEPTRELGVAMAEGRVAHGGNPVLAWCAGHIIGKEDGNGLIMPDKRRSRDKIDPLVAVLMAFSEALFHQRTRPSFYEQNDVERG